MKTSKIFATLASLFIAFGCVGCMGEGSVDDGEPDVAFNTNNANNVNNINTINNVNNMNNANNALDMDSVEDMSEQDFAVDMPAEMGPIGTAGCLNGAGLPEGENTFMLENRDRRFLLRLPNGYTNDKAWPLVFALHGNGGNPGYWDATSGDRNIRAALEDEAILIIAHAIDNQWRDYNMPQDTWPARIESELLYFDEMITMASENLCVDPDEIFSMGFSGGGSFSGVLGCRRTDIRAIAVGGSVIYFDEANCVGTPAAWVTIGTEELTGGREAYRDFFRDRAGCEATATDTTPSPCTAYDNCEQPVHYCQHPAGHIWPDFGSEAMWAFFSQFVDED